MPKTSRPVQANQNGPDQKVAPKTVLASLGPGLITGAADDDPSGIATYSQVGAVFGYSMLWTMLFSFPLMAAIQEICARLGRITGVGLAANLKRVYPNYVAYSVVSLLCAANLFNLGADISAMASAAKLLVPGPAAAFAVGFGGLSLLLQVFIPYRKYVQYLRWLTWSLFAYFITAFLIHVPWRLAIRLTLVPSISLDTPYLMALVGVLGTTISPYLFFWQTSEEAEEVRVRPQEAPLRKKPWQASASFRRIALDTRTGMGFSNLIGYFIILTTAATLHGSKSATMIQSSADAAKALEPLAGKSAFLLFALGIIGTGMLAVPVLAGSAAYAVAELFHWRASLDHKPGQAPKFYAVLAIAIIMGIGLNFLGIDPIRALYLSAVLNGIVAVPLMFLIMLMAANTAVVRQFRLPAYLRIAGWFATGAMLMASVFFIASAIRQALR
ncbi:MAG: divalent metal cation transporter [Acidobacteriia bacterium]|nr:divalent metal cation transporter [Terriglobia bacterium]